MKKSEDFTGVETTETSHMGYVNGKLIVNAQRFPGGHSLLAEEKDAMQRAYAERMVATQTFILERIASR